MTSGYAREIGDNVFYVGVKDWNRRLFDALIPLPQGTTYNSYLVKGSEKTCLIDTVAPGFESNLKNKINDVADITKIDYLVMNHAEPDHASAISFVLKKNEKIKVYATKRGAEALKIYFQVPDEQIHVVSDGDSLDLGGKTLRFIEAPMLHWPETMFTYLEEDRILFSCDFFGLHTSFGFYDDEVPEMISFAQRYFGEIMMPYASMGKRAMAKIKDLDIELIAPSHGPLHRNPSRIMDAYNDWTNGVTKEKVIVVYVSMWGSTEKLINSIVTELTRQGIEVVLHNLVVADIGDLARDLVDSRGIVLGTPTLAGHMHPLAVYAAHLYKILRPPIKYGVVLSSYGWGKGAVRQASEMLGPTKLDVIGTLEIHGAPTEADLASAVEIGKTLAEKIKMG